MNKNNTYDFPNHDTNERMHLLFVRVTFITSLLLFLYVWLFSTFSLHLLAFPNVNPTDRVTQNMNMNTKILIYAIMIYNLWITYSIHIVSPWMCCEHKQMIMVKNVIKSAWTSLVLRTDNRWFESDILS